MSYIHTLKRYGAVTRAYFRANDAYVIRNLDRYEDVCLALRDKRNALIDEIKAYVAHPVRVRRFADDFVDGQWHIEYGRYLIRRQQILTACRLLGIDSREIRF
nr:MAG TPA: hypothetical protein [Caudoviricetes sp.]DAH84477.1 MAG TPA: hypothetical protein [Caudoviricetes sp.]